MFKSHTYPRRGTAGGVTRVGIWLLLSLLLHGTFLRAQYNNRPDYQLLWRIDGPGLRSHSYLFGTMHLTNKRVFDFSDSVLTALRSASSFAMEVDMDSVMAYMLSPGGPLNDTVNYARRQLSPEEYHYVDSLVREKAGVPVEKLNIKRLWFLEQLLVDEEEALNGEEGSGGKAENIFLDGWLHEKATRLNKPVHSLERLENQLNIVSADVTAMQKEAFLQSIGYRHNGNSNEEERADQLKARLDYLDGLVNLYYEGNLQEIAAEVDRWGDREDGPTLEYRNREMAANLAALIKKGSVFAAVGVAHLPGHAGILALLREKGYTVTPVTASFTGIAEKDRRQLDSLKGYSLNRIADGYSITMPGVPVAYPLPNVNRSMYVGGSESEAGFAYVLDMPQLATDRDKLVKGMINNMASQANAHLEKSYPITYRNVPGEEAVLRQDDMLYHIRMFIRSNRAFMFMYSTRETDSSARKDFFRSVRFYDVVRPVTVYDTINAATLGFSVVMPSEATHVKIEKDEDTRPEEVYAGLDDANGISYVFRIEKIQRGYYNTDDGEMLKGMRRLLLGNDSTLQLIDSSMTEKKGLPQQRLVFRHHNGFISRLQFIPRGNLTYCLFCTYDSSRTDSSYWQRFLNGFKLLSLQSKAPVVPFTPDDSSFTITGPVAFSSSPAEEDVRWLPLKYRSYTAMDSISYSSYVVEVYKYARYYHNHPDSLVKNFIYKVDTTFILTGNRKYTANGLLTYEAELKGRYTGLRFYRKAVVAGQTVYRLSAILPEELKGASYGQQFLAAFHPGARERADTALLQQKKLALLLHDLQSTDTALFQQAKGYLQYMSPDSSDVQPILTVLAAKFPSDKQDNDAKLALLLALKDIGGDPAIHAAEVLYAGTGAVKQRENILYFLNGLHSDSAIRTFLRLARELPEQDAPGRGIFTFAFRKDSLYRKYMPQMIDVAEHSPGFLQSFIKYTYYDSLWLQPQVDQYNLKRLLPGLTQLFDRQLQQWKSGRHNADSSWRWQYNLTCTGQVLALPGMPAVATTTFRELLADSVMALRALAARALINQGIRVNDSILRSILTDYNTGYAFAKAMQDNKKLPLIRHLLSQELLGRSYVANILSDDYDIKAVELVTKVKVQQGKTPAVWLNLYRYKTDDDKAEWEYVLNGPYPLDASKLNFEPNLLEWIDENDIVTDKAKLTAAAEKAYKNYTEDN